jgi:hypothetical protein
VDETGDDGKSEVEGVSGAAVCSLLMIWKGDSSPSSGPADAKYTFCSTEMVPELGQKTL